ncbi:MAG: TonB-dependent receptor, partial [Acidobacteriota bacterium]|nr:TonB-dependent receptor [Acidobacteriota bacterium]
PRLGVTFDPRGDGRVLLSASYGHYFEPFLQQFVDSFSELDSFSGYTRYNWAGPATPGCDSSADPSNITSPCWINAQPVGFFGVQAAPPNPSVRRSWVQEVTAGFEQQLTATTGVSLYFIQRRWHHLWEDIPQHTFDSQGNQTGAIARILNLPEARRRYQAIELLVQKRFADHWQLLGSYTHSKSEGNLFEDNGMTSFADFRGESDVNVVNRYGPAPYDREHQIKVFSNYQIPFERWNVSLGSSLRYESGVPYQMVTSDPLGFRFLTPRGSLRLPDVLQLDLALGTEVRLGNAVELETKLEVFNVTDEQRVLGAESLIDTGIFGKPRSIVDLQAPRSYRITLGFRF